MSCVWHSLDDVSLSVILYYQQGREVRFPMMCNSSLRHSSAPTALQPPCESRSLENAALRSSPQLRLLANRQRRRSRWRWC